MADVGTGLEKNSSSTNTQNKTDVTPTAENTQENIPQVSVESLAKGMAQRMPEAQPYVETQQNTQQTHTTPPIDVDPNLKDRMGRTFNPKYHAVDANGKPQLTRTGKLRLLRETKEGRKKAKQKSRLETHQIGPSPINALPPSSSGEKQEATNNTKPASEVNELQRKAMGVFFVNMTVNLSVGVFGDEWQASKDEYLMMNSAMQAYLDAKGVEDLPPGWALVGAFGAYALPRLAKPKTRSTLDKIVDWMKAKFIEIKTGGKYKVTPKKPPENKKPTQQNVDVPSREEYESEQRGGFSPSPPVAMIY